jgi:hypothetical protein
MASAFLAGYYDPGVELRDESPEEMEQFERERLYVLFAVASAAGQIPRRVGGDADGDELRNDKKRCRRIAHVAEQCFKAWGGVPGKGVAKDISKEAAQVFWDKWWANHQVVLKNRIAYIASYGLQHAEHERWAKKSVVRLTNEQSWLSYALRD